MLYKNHNINSLSSIVRIILVIGAGISALAPMAYADTTSWQHQIVTLVTNNQSYPRIAQARKEEGVAKVRIYLEASGAVTKVELITSSGSDILDKETEKLFQKLGQLPAPPAGITTLVVPVAWRLN